MSLLNRAVIRLAYTNKALRPHLLPLLKEASAPVEEQLQKEAAKDTADFVTWALTTQRPIAADRVIKFLERNGVEFVEDSGPSKRGTPLEVGELVEIQANNAPSDLKDLLAPFHLQKGNVVQVDGKDVVIRIQAGPLLRVPGGVETGKASGVYRTSQMEEREGRAHFEIVYLPANEKKPSTVSVEVLREYVEKGMAAGEERSENYFSGFVPSWKNSKAGAPYFMVWTQQRGGRPRTMSPTKGQVYYIERIGKRPGNWQAELAESVASAEAPEE